MEEITLEIKHKTEQAFLLTDGDNDGWFPMSLIDWEEPDEIGDTTTFYIPEWKLEQEGFI